MTNYESVFNSGKNHVLRLVIETQSQDINNNGSTIYWRLEISSNPSYNPYGSDGNWGVNINGATGSGNMSYDFRNYDYLKLGEGTVWVPHNADGTKTINVSGNAYIGSAGGSANVSGSYTIATIPRASTMTWSGNVFPGTAKAFDVTEATAGFTHIIDYTFGASSGRVATNVDDFSWTPDMALLNEMPNSATKTGNLRLHTYNGESLIGYRDYTFTMEAPTSANPTFTALTLSEGTAGVAANVGKYVQNVSSLNAAITGASAKYGATITAYKIEGAGALLNAQSGVTPVISQFGASLPIVATITDSRGRTASQTVNIEVLAYTPPIINSMTLSRATSAGVATDSPQAADTYVRVNINAAVQSLMNTSERNQLVYKVFSRARGTSSWGTAKVTSSLAAGTLTFNSYALVSPYALEQAWEFLVQVSDDFNITEVQGTIAVAGVFMHWGTSAQGLGIGKFWERGGVDVRGQMWQNNGRRVLDTATLTGNQTARDAFWGVPGTAAARLALHALGAQWVRTDKGWTEQYFAAVADGATRNDGAVTLAGWYPISGRLPRSKRYRAGGSVAFPTMTYSMAVGMMNVSLHDSPEIPIVTLANGGGDDDDMQITLPGVYDLRANLHFSFGGGSHEAAWFLSKVAWAANSGWDTTLGKNFEPGNGTAYTALRPDAGGVLFAAPNYYVRLRVASSTSTTGICYSDVFWNEIRYISPPFVAS